MIEHKITLPCALNMADRGNNMMLVEVVKILLDNKDVYSNVGITDLIADDDIISATEEGFKVNINHPRLSDTYMCDVFNALDLALTSDVVLVDKLITDHCQLLNDYRADYDYITRVNKDGSHDIDIARTVYLFNRAIVGLKLLATCFLRRLRR